VGAAGWDVPTPVVDVRPSIDEAVPEEIPERVWEADELSAAVEEDARATEPMPQPMAAALIASSIPSTLADEDKTQVVDLPPRSRRGWALAAGMVVGAIGVVAFGPAVVRRSAPPAAEPTPSVSPPVIQTQVKPPEPPAPVAEPEPEPEAPPAPVVAAPPHFTVGIKGSLAGANRYLLRAPDGVAYNLPHAKPTLAMGTYEAALPGVRSVWVRPLAGGGTNVRVFFSSTGRPPNVKLDADGVTVTSAEK
jgi:hypothetical protein